MYCELYILLFTTGLHGKNGPITFTELLVPVMTVPIHSTHSFGQFLFTMNLREIKNSYIETQAQKKENSAKYVTTNSIFIVYALV